MWSMSPVCEEICQRTWRRGSSSASSTRSSSSSARGRQHPAKNLAASGTPSSPARGRGARGLPPVADGHHAAGQPGGATTHPVSWTLQPPTTRPAQSRLDLGGHVASTPGRGCRLCALTIASGGGAGRLSGHRVPGLRSRYSIDRTSSHLETAQVHWATSPHQTRGDSGLSSAGMEMTSNRRAGLLVCGVK